MLDEAGAEGGFASARWALSVSAGLRHLYLEDFLTMTNVPNLLMAVVVCQAQGCVTGLIVTIAERGRTEICPKAVRHADGWKAVVLVGHRGEPRLVAVLPVSGPEQGGDLQGLRTCHSLPTGVKTMV